jgi:O-antigen/teichoic acid export membrane protein
LHKIFKNSGWLLADKLARLFLGLLTMALIARQVGPADFGVWSYALALTTIVGGLAVLGLDKVVVKELVSYPDTDKQERILTTALFMRLFAGLLSFAVCAAIVLLTKKGNAVYTYCTLLTALNIVLQSFDVFDYYYQAKNDVQQVIIPKTGIFVLFCVLKMVWVTKHASLMSFVWLSFFELLITYAIILTMFIGRHSMRFLRAFSFSEAKFLLQHSWPLLFTGVLVLLYMKSDQLMLDTLGTPALLGEYAAAARISELWYALPTVIATALLPGLVQKRIDHHAAYELAVEKWLRLSFWCSLGIALVLSPVAPVITNLFYGAQFPQSGLILSIHVWANIPVFLCMVLMQYQIVEGAYNINLYATIAGIIMNVGINVLLIPKLGGVGAAIATVVSYMTVFCTLTFMDKTKRLPYMISRMFSPLLAINDLKHLFDSFRLFTGQFLSFKREKFLTK